MRKAFSFTVVVALCLSAFLTQGWAGLQRAKIKPGHVLRPHKIALIIGINRSTKSRYWEPLKYAHRDAKRMAIALQKQAKFDKIILLNRPSNTTTKALNWALQRLHYLVKSKEDTVLVYISAHGMVSQGRNRFIVTSDTTRRVSQTALSVRSMRKGLERLRSQKIGLILATCYTGGTTSKSVRIPGYKGKLQPEKFSVQNHAIQILSAASYAQPAFESRRLKSDVYTHFFLNCFRKVKSKTIIKIHVCAAALTTPFVQKLNGEVQVPKAYSVLGANRDFPLVLEGDKKRKVGYFRPRWKRPNRLLLKFRPLGKKGISSEVRSPTKSELTALKPGKYKVVVANDKGRVVDWQHIKISPGSELELLSNWVVDVHVSSIFSEKGGSGKLWGSTLGLHHHQFPFGFKIGAWTDSRKYHDSETSHQLYLELRLEGGYRFRKAIFELFLGGYVGGGVMFKHLRHSTEEREAASLFTYGMTIAPCLWLTSWFGLSFQGDLGASLYNARVMTHEMEWALRLGVYIRL